MSSEFQHVKHIGDIPVEWQVEKLADITPAHRRIVYGIVQAGPHVEGGVPYIRSTDVGGALKPDLLPRTTKEIATRYKRSEVKPGDIVFSLRGNIGASSIVPPNLAGANLTQGTARISPNGRHCNRFVRYALQSGSVVKRISALSKGSTFREISLEELRKIVIPIPSTEEQRGIADAIDLWSHSLSLLEKLIKQKRKLKKGLMQQLLTSKRRFPEFAGEKWTEFHLGDLFDERDESNRPDLPLLSITADRGVISRNEIKGKDSSNEDKSKYKRIAHGDIGYNTMRMWQGVSALSSLEGIVSPAYTICTPRERIDAEFAKHLFKFPPVVHLFYRYSQGMTSDTWNLKYHHFSQIKVTIPSVAEQRRIAEVLDAVDLEIRLLREQQNAVEEQKKGLMQQLLTGKVRVPVEQKEVASA